MTTERTLRETARMLGDRYRLGRAIGRGGMAEVFLAHDDRTGGAVALKLVRTELIKDRRFLRRFAVEVRALASVEHPNVVQFLDAGVTADRPFLVMELIRGPSLRDWVKDRGPLESRLALRLLRQMGSGLAALHDAGLVHRDVKPSNVMLVLDEDVPVDAKIADLGLAKVPSIQGLTRTGTAIGSPTYMAPEQVVGDPPDARSDIYGWGMCLFYALTGERPFEGTRAQVMRHQVRSTSPPVSWFVDELAPELDCLLAGALRKNPANRYGSMDLALQDVDSVLHQAGSVQGAQVVVEPDEYQPAHAAAREWLRNDEDLG